MDLIPGFPFRQLLKPSRPRRPKTLAFAHSVLLQRMWGPQRVGEGSLLQDVVKMLRRKLSGDA